MVPSHSCYIYATRKSKEVGRGEILKPAYENENKFLWDVVDPYRHDARNLQPGDCSFVN